MKLSRYGIEIYAAIDGYSRYILWIYVGISTRTAISVYKQYVNAVSSFGYIPQMTADGVCPRAPRRPLGG
jgi:hypothetical protein